MSIDLEIEGDKELLSKFRRAKIRAKSVGVTMTQKGLTDLRDDVRRESRRFRRTGRYENSIVVRGGAVSTSHPAARRLERGFVGTDSAGRTYNQGPRPHWLPAVRRARARLRYQARKEIRNLVD